VSVQASAEAAVDSTAGSTGREAFAATDVLGIAHATSKEASASDESLMAAYRDRNDAAAFEQLYRRHRNGLYRYLLRQCGLASVAEELFQDVWFGVIRAKRKYVIEARFATYLYKIAHNRLIDHYRRAAHRPSVPAAEDCDPVDLLPAEAISQPEVKLEAKEQIERFSALLAVLPESQREAFVLHEEAGLSIDEIAIATGVNHETAKSRLRYAVARLRRGMLEWA
jgi:RNA polymerase sigma-70 factor (ECF subfamily)